VRATFLTHPIDSKTPSYGNRTPIILKDITRISDGDTANTTDIHFTNNHIGTHVDVPKHFYENGKTITNLNPEEWIFQKVSLIDITCTSAMLISVENIRMSHLKPDVDFLIIRTSYGQRRNEESYWSDYPGIAPDACSYLRESFPTLRGIGFDFISLTSPKFKEEGKAAHRILLDDSTGRFVLIVEDMKIDHLTEAPFILCVSPLLIQDGNGGPATVLAIDPN
jgi:arylformamidase